ncbi:MAG: YggT family protein [Desulfobulbaceae bacterium]|nr:YggT family protein [Desulfobulbaceae bacterium]
MFVFSNFISAMATLIDLILGAYIWIIIGRAIVSWVSADPYNPIVRFVYEATEPLLARIRKVVPTLGGGIDFSPMILIVAIMFLRSFIVPTLQQLARSIG